MRRRRAAVSPCLAVLLLSLCVPSIGAANLRLNEKNYFETHGLNVLLFHNSYLDVFGDQKMGGLEIILHEQRIATNGDVRLSPTPAQWDPIPSFLSGVTFQSVRQCPTMTAMESVP